MQRISRLIKPPWFSGGSILGLLIQLCLSIMLLYAIAANKLGIIHGKDEAILTPLICALIVAWAIVAIVAVVGIYRHRWWAYFLEIGVLAAVVSMAYLVPDLGTPQPEVRSDPLKQLFPWSLIAHEYVQAAFQWIGFCLLVVALWKAGSKRRAELRTVVDQA